MKNQVTDIFKDKGQTYSFELFPPKTEKGYQKLLGTLGDLCRLQPDFISCTYGAGGGNREKTLEIAQHIQEQLSTPSIAHLTCVCHTKDEIRGILQDMKTRGIGNILALRGDPPLDNPDWQPGKNNFRYAKDLCAFVREEFGHDFTIGVAGFPEGHPLCPELDQDARFLKEKVDNGADFVITQLFFDNAHYFDYVKRLRALGVNSRVIPGILPITHYDNLLRFCQSCGTTIPSQVHEIFKPIREDKDKMLEEGIRFCIQQCRELLEGGAPGLHFYALNKLHPVDTILKNVRI